jgi:hypothetical protein
MSLSVITLDGATEEATKEDSQYEQVSEFLDCIHRGNRIKQQEYRVSSAREARPICSRMAADCRRTQARYRENASKQI